MEKLNKMTNAYNNILKLNNKDKKILNIKKTKGSIKRSIKMILAWH